MTTRHVRINGWCHHCDGAGRTAFEHADATLDGCLQPTWDVEDVTRVWQAALTLIAEHIHADARQRLTELHGHGCEAAAERAWQHGRLQVVEADMWAALGLDPPRVGS